MNTAHHLVGGIVEAMQGDSVTMINMDNDAATGPGAVDFSNPNDTVYITSPIDSVYMNPDSTWTVITSDGETVVITPGEGGTMVVDPDGNGVVIVDGQVYTVTTGGGNQDGTGTGTEVTPTAICQQIVSFKPGGSLHKYGFDTYKDKMPPGTYHAVNVDDKSIHLPWKSVATGGSDRLYAETSSSSAPAFTYQSGQPVTASSSESGYQLWTGTPPAGEDNLLAMCGESAVAGGVRVKSYDLVRHKVAVVPVGNSQPSFTAAQLQNALNQIYAQAVIEWQVTLEQPISAANIPTLNDGLEVAETDYSPEMRSIKWAYLAQRTPAPNTVYLFVISGFTGKDDWVGYMPLNTSYGFLTPNATVRDAAHELGHGVFNLRHTFSNDNIVTLPQSSTQNLMDYPSTSSGQVPGTELFKYQWDNIHDPEGGWFVFEDSEEGAMSLPCVGWFDDCKDVLQILETFRNSRINGNNVKIKGQEITNERVLVANYVKVGDTDYKKIRLIYKPKTEDFLITPLEYVGYDQQFFIADGSVDTQRGFVYYEGNNEIFKILVDDEINKIDELNKYLFGQELKDTALSSARYNIDIITAAAEDVTDILNNTFGETSSCNYAVRDVFYKISEEVCLFPEEGSLCYLCEPDTTIIGLTTNPGRANNIADDFEREKYKKFELLPTVSDPNHPENQIPDFNKIQNLANDGYLIIGAKKKINGSGHVVLAVSGELGLYTRGNGDSYMVPVVLECGYGEKYAKALASKKWLNQVLNTMWYIYKP